MNFDAFFRHAFGKADDQAFEPFDYQVQLAVKDWPDLLDVPTGMGKTAAVTLAWLWKRGWRQGGRTGPVENDTPRRLIWCLPMRVLVEQTAENIRQWLQRLDIYGKAGEGKVSVHVLMGGADDLKTWAEYPEEDMILIGTQDMLLSRALLRGYGMSRYQWPIHFALLHNDCLWVFDEVQLMGAGLATSAQLEAFRRSFPLAEGSRTLWVSATLNRDWLATVDMRPHIDSLARHTIGDEDRRQAGNRLQAVKSLQKATFTLTKESNKQRAKDYLDRLRTLVLENHDEHTQTLVIVNRVERAQQLFRLLRAERPGNNDLLIHARFRAAERAEQAQRLRNDADVDRIVVATQAIEAGVDVSSRVMVTELAPWASMVQRFGRCNRDGKHNSDGARILWVDVENDKDLSRPYTAETLALARAKLNALDSASPNDLPATSEERPLTAVLRRKDLLDLFNTDPDLSGFDVDVSDYIRDSGMPGVQVFWREFANDPNQPEPQGRPSRKELCPASMGQIKELAKRKDMALWYWDTLDGQWTKLKRDPRPGMVLLARAADGGYDTAIGFDATQRKAPVRVIASGDTHAEPDFSGDQRSLQNKSVALPDHLGHVADHAARLCAAVNETNHSASVIRAGRWHDLGKLHEVFQQSMYRCRLPADSTRPLAKSDCPGRMRHSRPFFRHELVSMLGWLAQHDGEPDADLIAYLILAHHGKVRMSLRAMPTEADHVPTGVKRFARGVYEGDSLPALEFDGEYSETLILELALMELGEGKQGHSWTERALRLLDQYGPFQLAWMETLVRLADWRASAAEQLEPDTGEPHNGAHGLDHGHQALAQPATTRTAAAAAGKLAAQSGEEHGLRGRTGGSGDAGSRTRPPHAATRYLDTSLGILSYAELAPPLARRVEAVQNAVREGELDDQPLDETLFLELHRRICGDLTPDFAGRWRKQEVVVGNHHPPLPHRVAPAMREYALDLEARIEALPADLDERWLETLAFAEGRLLSIHPFTDFNGRTTRVFIDWLTRRLELPDVDPTPDEGAATQRYLTALRAGDRRDWRPLMTIWRERLEQENDA
ncbi:MAG: type I-G CRISPR-associated helicase/endonuclease Cas3g [Rhodanobacteraceae bacterium]